MEPTGFTGIAGGDKWQIRCLRLIGADWLHRGLSGSIDGLRVRREELEGLERGSFCERQKLRRLLGEGITVEDGNVTVMTIIPTGDDNGQLRSRRDEVRLSGDFPTLSRRVGIKSAL